MRRTPIMTMRWFPRSHTQSLRAFVAHARQTSKQADTTVPSAKTTGLLYVVEPAKSRGSFRRFLSFATPERRYIAAAIVSTVAYSAATLAIPAGFGALVDAASHGTLPVDTSLQLVACFTAAGVANFLRLAATSIGGERVIASLRKSVFAAMMRQPASFFDTEENRTGALVQRISMDCNVVGCSLTEGLTSGAKNILQAVGSLAVMLYYSTALTGVVLFLLPPLAVFAGFYGRAVRRLQVRMQDALAVMGTASEERLSAIRTVKAFGRESMEVAWFNTRVQSVYDISRRLAIWNASYVGCLHFAGYLAMYAMLWVGSLLVSSGDITGGVLFSFVLYMVYCGIGIMGVSQLATDLNKGYGASLRLFEILDSEDNAAAKGATPALRPDAPKGLWTFESISFAYPTRPDAPILSNLTLRLEPGRSTCIVGASGSGKSTLAMLLVRLYSPQSGTVALDGVPLESIDTQWLQESIGYVGQEPVLFGGSIAQNLAYGLRDRSWDDPVDGWTMDEVVKAAKEANANTFISSLPDAYGTFVGEGGRALSGGQKQRLAIARALVRKPLLLIFDEATSALDSESERIVLETIERLIADAKGSRRTFLMLAHKLSVIRMADHIVVLEDGAVRTEGTFEEVRRDAYFRQLTGLSEDGTLEPQKK